MWIHLIAFRSSSDSLPFYNCRQFALHARNYSVSESINGNKMVVRPYVCGNLCVCCDCCCRNSQLDASEYYTSEERRLAALVDEEKIQVYLVRCSLIESSVF